MILYCQDYDSSDSEGPNYTQANAILQFGL